MRRSILALVVPCLIASGAPATAQVVVDAVGVRVPEAHDDTIDALFVVSLSAIDEDHDTTVGFATADGSAHAGADYATTSGVATIPAGQRTAVVHVPVFGDAIPEGDETFHLDIFSPSEFAIVGEARATATVEDDQTLIAKPLPEAWTLTQVGMPGQRGIAWTGSQAVAVGVTGDIWTSPDGVAWTKRTNPDPVFAQLNAVGCGPTGCVAVGQASVSGPVILTSPDGATWTQRQAPAGIFQQLRAAAHGAGTWVAVGNGGRVISSADNGATWTNRSPAPAVPILNGVAFGGGGFVAVGNAGTIRRSTDGTAWVPAASVPGGLGNLLGVTWTGSQFVAVGTAGAIATSPDGASWTQRTSPAIGNLNAVTTLGGLIVAVGAGAAGAPSTVFTSPDGIAWSGYALPLVTGSVRSLLAVADAGGRLVALGNVGTVWTSDDGSTWTSRTLPESRAWLRAIDVDDDTLCAVGIAGAVATTTDGITWTTQTFQPDPTFSAQALVHHAGHIFAVGSSLRIFQTDDCVNWTVANETQALPAGAVAINLLDVTSTGSHMVAAGGKIMADGSAIPLIYTSPDGQLWTERATGLPPGTLGFGMAIAAGGGRVTMNGADYAVSGTAYQSLSLDGGFTWEAQPWPFELVDNFNDITYLGGSFLAAGGRPMWSRDGVNWTLAFDDAVAFIATAWGDGRWALGGANGHFAMSSDAARWTFFSVPTNHNFYFAAAGYLRSQRRFVMLGDSAMAYATLPPENTPEGVDVTATIVDPGTGAPAATVTFDNVTESGETVVTEATVAPVVPAGFELGDPPLYYDVSTTATFGGEVEVCLHYEEGMFANEATVRLLHFESGAWVDRTTSVDTSNNVACGAVTSLSPFAIVKVANEPPHADAGPDLTVECTSAAGAAVALDGSASSDPDGDDLAFDWSGPFGHATGMHPSVSLPLGSSSVGLVVSDGSAAASDHALVLVRIQPVGLLNPLGALVTEGEVPPIPGHAVKAGASVPLKLRLSCSGTSVVAGVPAPRLVALARNGEPIDLAVVDPGAGTAADSGGTFRAADGQWIYNLSTRGLSAGQYRLTMAMPDGRRWEAALMLR